MATPAKKAPAKKAPAKKAASKKAEPEVKEEPKEPVFDGVAEAEPAPPEEVKDEKKGGSAKDTLDRVAADRGWVLGPAPEGFDVAYTKSNPVLGGYEYLRVAFKGSGIGEVEHENLNRSIPFPEDGSKLDNAISVLTGEPA